MLSSIDPEKKEMETIIKRSQSGVILDENSQRKDMERFKEIQDKLMKLDMDFKKQLKEMSEDLNTSVYDQLSVIVEEWSKANSINLVMGKMEVIFNTEDIDATEQILEVIKEKGMFYTESVSGEVVEPNM
jgi:Skp family chaperone for outer membrane proteins